jgi:hypothetical protein
MDRHRLKKLLEQAERRMFEGAWRVARQKQLIEEMLARGVDVRPYRAVLATFEDTLHLQVYHVQLIKRELYDPTKGERPVNPNTLFAKTAKGEFKNHGKVQTAKALGGKGRSVLANRPSEIAETSSRRRSRIPLRR